MGEAAFNAEFSQAIRRWHELHDQFGPNSPAEIREFGDLTRRLEWHYSPVADFREAAGLARFPDTRPGVEPEPEGEGPDRGPDDQPPPPEGMEETDVEETDVVGPTGDGGDASSGLDGLEDADPDEAPPLGDEPAEPEIIDSDSVELDEPPGREPPHAEPLDVPVRDVTDAEHTGGDPDDPWPETVMGREDYQRWLRRAIKRWWQLRTEPITRESLREFGNLTDDLARHYPRAADARQAAGLPRYPEPLPPSEAPALPPEESGQPEIIDPDSLELDEPWVEDPPPTDVDPPARDLSSDTNLDPPGGYTETQKEDVWFEYSPDIADYDPGSEADEEDDGDDYEGDGDGEFIEIHPPTAEPDGGDDDSAADDDFDSLIDKITPTVGPAVASVRRPRAGTLVITGVFVVVAVATALGWAFGGRGDDALTSALAQAEATNEPEVSLSDRPAVEPEDATADEASLEAEPAPAVSAVEVAPDEASLEAEPAPAVSAVEVAPDDASLEAEPAPAMAEPDGGAGVTEVTPGSVMVVPANFSRTGGNDECTDFTDSIHLRFVDANGGTMAFPAELDAGQVGRPFEFSGNVVQVDGVTSDVLPFVEFWSIDLAAGTGTSSWDFGEPGYCEWRIELIS